MGKLYLIPTPVGNLEDITLRALRLLKEVSLVLAEDTRTTANLFHHYNIKTPLLSHHKFNEHQQVANIAEKLQKGEDIALVSDAGTPGISDPGFLLVRTCVEQGIETECLPGATAFVPALVNSGFPCDRFCFEGFLPQKKGRQKRLLALAEESRTIIFYESPYRLVKALEQMSGIFGNDRKACVAREISKKFEEYKRGTLNELHEYFTHNGVKGEIVLLVAGKGKEESEQEED
ncbi:16S rRNA (cytidine(1402)-2'-O)-methyltransferase [Odoribacter lunatus]|uniref:16S rRNA (cytidine(1402)-2'-O)-methyltransferase n=1 Tax=Odoribacter lunatus TaxID=2941335 RepID=UPI00203C6392|nr:16S rRNA (cytidine(1402)-2'-O)-methyltransferase [Odoribacter lunatus]